MWWGNGDVIRRRFGGVSFGGDGLGPTILAPSERKFDIQAPSIMAKAWREQLAEKRKTQTARARIMIDKRAGIARRGALEKPKALGRDVSVNR